MHTNGVTPPNPPELSLAASLLDSVSTAILCLDTNLRVQWVNASAEQLLGVGARRVVGKRLTHFVSLPDEVFTRLRDTLRHEQGWTERQVAITPHGHEPVTVDCTVSLTPLGAGLPGLVLELTAIDRPMRIARDEALQTQQAHARSLLRGLAHEIKNPLGGLRGAAQLLERQLPDSELEEYTSIIIREADRLQNLIDRMLGPVGQPQRNQVNVHEVMEHVRTISAVGAPAAVTWIVDYDPSIPECLTDRDRLVQVVLNIVGNALHAVGNEGALTFRSRVLSGITIGSRRHRLAASLEIHDDGPGVPDHLIDQIFYPMVTGTEHGTGLGLSIAQSTMNQLGGLIECRSEPGHTVFTVLVPLEPLPDAPGDIDANSDAHGSATHQPSTAA